MKKLAVYGHCTVDTISISGKKHEQIGGSACYCAITARKMGFEAHMITRFGPDFPREYLEQNGISYGSVSDMPTTRFSLEISGTERTLQVLNVCDDVSYEDISDADCRVISPLFGEISKDVFARICKDSGFSLLDPQGFLRVCSDTGKTSAGSSPAKVPCTIALQDADIDMSGVDAIKVNADEAPHITGGLTGDAAMAALQSRGIKHVIYTDNAAISLLSGGRIYSIHLPNKAIHDTTGIGDIFCSAFCCTMIRERDILWALCFAGGAAQAALDSKDVGLLKVPRKGSIQTNASYFYNTIKFRNL